MHDTAALHARTVSWALITSLMDRSVVTFPNSLCMGAIGGTEIISDKCIITVGLIWSCVGCQLKRTAYVSIIIGFSKHVWSTYCWISAPHSKPEIAVRPDFGSQWSRSSCRWSHLKFNPCDGCLAFLNNTHNLSFCFTVLCFSVAYCVDVVHRCGSKHCLQR